MLYNLLIFPILIAGTFYHTQHAMIQENPWEILNSNIGSTFATIFTHFREDQEPPSSLNNIQNFNQQLNTTKESISNIAQKENLPPLHIAENPVATTIERSLFPGVGLSNPTMEKKILQQYVPWALSASQEILTTLHKQLHNLFTDTFSIKQNLGDALSKYKIKLSILSREQIQSIHEEILNNWKNIIQLFDTSIWHTSYTVNRSMGSLKKPSLARQLIQAFGEEANGYQFYLLKPIFENSKESDFYNKEENLLYLLDIYDHDLSKSYDDVTHPLTQVAILLEKILEKRPQLIDECKQYGFSPLHSFTDSLTENITENKIDLNVIQAQVYAVLDVLYRYGGLEQFTQPGQFDIKSQSIIPIHHSQIVKNYYKGLITSKFYELYHAVDYLQQSVA